MHLLLARCLEDISLREPIHFVEFLTPLKSIILQLGEFQTVPQNEAEEITVVWYFPPTHSFPPKVLVSSGQPQSENIK